jgi:hypothetical protein
VMKSPRISKVCFCLKHNLHNTGESVV